MNHPLPLPHMWDGCRFDWLVHTPVSVIASVCSRQAITALDENMVIVDVFSAVLLPIYQKLLRNKLCAVWQILFKRCSYQPVFVQTHTNQCFTGPQ
jgi:hypothetical protein